METALLSWLTRLFLQTQLKSKSTQSSEILPFILAFLGIIAIHFLMYLGMKQSFISFSGQEDSIGSWHLLLSMSIGVVFGLVIVGMQYLIFYFKREQQISLKIEQAEKAKTDAQLLSLQQQLNPHFMFNNFNTLHGLIHENPAEASEFLLELSDLYRGVLAVTQEELIPLKQEMELVNHFNFLLNK
ncbi:MAG: sensor histidine kinase YesM [Flammeovirgaceae bacterium]